MLPRDSQSNSRSLYAGFVWSEMLGRGRHHQLLVEICEMAYRSAVKLRAMHDTVDNREHRSVAVLSVERTH